MEGGKGSGHSGNRNRGIMNTQDALEFFLAGACMVQIGTGNFIDPQTSIKIVSGLNGYLKEKGIRRIADLVGKLKTG